MIIENADPALSSYMARVVASEMARSLFAAKVNVEDDKKVIEHLFRHRFGTATIANLMASAQDIVRKKIVRVAVLIFLAVGAAALSPVSFFADAAVIPSVRDLMEAGGCWANGSSTSHLWKPGAPKVRTA